MSKQAVALSVAIVVAVIGSIFAIRALTSARVRTAEPVPVEVPESVRSALTNAKIDTAPTGKTLDEVPTELRRRVLEKLREIPTLSSVPESARGDLADAFVERWRALIDPDVTRDHQTLAARGDPRSLSDAAADFEGYQTWMESLSPFGLDGLVVTDNADPAALASAAGVAGFEGFRRGMSSRLKDKMPVPDNPVEEGWRSVQIVMPFAKQPLKGKGIGVVFLGFQFAWSSQRGQWVPYSTVWYVSPGEIHAAAPFR